MPPRAGTSPWPNVAPAHPRVWLRRAALLAALSSWSLGCCSLGVGRLEPRSADQYAEHVRALSDRAPAGSTAIVVPPFVVVGDGPPDEVRAAAQDVVQWAVRGLKADYFDRDPAQILDVWIFRSDDSYRENASALFGDVPPSPYGYYSPCDRAILVQAGLGYGTLVHELAHAFLEANFDDAPVWFQEGFASLFEQPEDDAGHIVGGVNWRLPALQERVREGRAASFDETMNASKSEFYRDPRAHGHGAVARYLLYYVQQQHLLPRYYREYRAAFRRDPTGAATLASVLGSDLSSLRRDWEQFVLGLRWPARDIASPRADNTSTRPAWW